MITAMPRSSLPPQTIAIRQMIFAGCVGLVVGATACVAAMAYLFVHLRAADEGAWTILHFVIGTVELSVIGALAGACVGALLVQGRDGLASYTRVRSAPKRQHHLRFKLRHQIRSLPHLLAVQLLSLCAAVAVQFVPGRAHLHPRG